LKKVILAHMTWVLSKVRTGHLRYNLFGPMLKLFPGGEQDPLAHQVDLVRAQWTCHVTPHVSAAPFFLSKHEGYKLLGQPYKKGPGKIRV
jgi:hypothetical protein